MVWWWLREGSPPLSPRALHVRGILSKGQWNSVLAFTDSDNIKLRVSMGESNLQSEYILNQSSNVLVVLVIELHKIKECPRHSSARLLPPWVDSGWVSQFGGGSGGFRIPGLGQQASSFSAGYTGELCQSKIDYCVLDPCRNGATCVSSLSGFTCQCLEGKICNSWEAFHFPF